MGEKHEGTFLLLSVLLLSTCVGGPAGLRSESRKCGVNWHPFCAFARWLDNMCAAYTGYENLAASIEIPGSVLRSKTIVLKEALTEIRSAVPEEGQ